MNSIATKDNSITTENSITMRQIKTMCLQQSFLCCYKNSSICQDQGIFYVATKENCVATQHSEPAMGDKTTMSRQKSFMSRQTQHEVEVNFVATKTNIVAIEVEKITRRMLQHRNLMTAKLIYVLS